MHKTLALWHADHVNFAKLLQLLDDQLALFHEGDTPQYELMLDIMYYMTHYCDVVHHPKEDLLFVELKARDKSIAREIDELIEQHTTLKDVGEKLVHDLDDIVNGSISSREHVEAAARRYVTELRNHMRAEETEILPLAARLLHNKDWAAIDKAIRDVPDPLFGSGAEARYDALRRQIARQARSSD
jgi:hemerythrin-like domain-containing protein